MQNWVITLSTSFPAGLVGRKAAALGRLIDAGFPVPPGVCVTTDAYHAAGSISPENLRLPDGLLEMLIRTLPMDTPLVVRSSAVVEDHPEISLAGRYITRLNVIGRDQIEQAVLDIWRSYRSAPVAGCEGCMAVLVQPLIDAECAGVCFTVDPIRLRPDLLMVASAWGLGSGVVSGSIPTDTARLRRTDLGIEDCATADKHTAARSVPSAGGVTLAPVPDGLRSIPCLPETWLQRVGQFGLSIEQLFGEPQDVEWAIAENKLWILQSRSVTALPTETREAARFPTAWSNKEEPRHFWWLAEGEHPLYPAEMDVQRLSTEGGQDAVYFGGSADTRWFKFFNGRKYMARAKSNNSPGRVRIYTAARQDLAKRMVRQDITLWEYWAPEVELATARLAAFDPRGVSSSALADHLEDALAIATRHWMVHTMGMAPRPIRSAALLDSYVNLTGMRSEDAAADIPFLLAGTETVQTRLVESLYDLACLALEDTEAAQEAALTWRAGSSLGTTGAESFARAFDHLMSIYGGRLCYRPVPGFPANLPFPWREAPQHVWEMVAAYLPLAREDGGLSPRAMRERALRDAEAHVMELCAAVPDPALAAAFRRTLAYARRNAASLDEHNHYIDQLADSECIQALFHAGRWLSAQGCLESMFDVFWLNIDEVLTALRDKTFIKLDGAISARREEFAGWQALIPPACLGLPESGLPGRSGTASRAPDPGPSPANVEENALTGQPASRGRASGRARIIYGSKSLAGVVPGDVLVTDFVSLEWAPILPILAALVLDFGSPGDHPAITAREFGVPSVCSTLNATKRIPEGAWVTVDAYTGHVTWTQDVSEPTILSTGD